MGADRQSRPRKHDPRTVRSAVRRGHLESLESRYLLDATSLLSGEDRYYTMSFAPDGVDIAGAPNVLMATMNAALGGQEWRETIARAFQTWVARAGIDIGVVSETGSFAFGTPGPSTGDDRFGDIRIGARPLAPNVMAIAVAQDRAASGTWATDIVFNSEATFRSLDDLYSVSLHEAGHVLGLGHSDDPLSPMHIHGVSTALSPTSADIGQLQALHGVRRPDSNEGGSGNDTRATATDWESVELSETEELVAPSIAFGAISRVGDVDYYRMTTSGDVAGGLVIRLEAAGISLLLPRVSWLDSQGHELAQVTASSILSNSLEYRVANVEADATYFVRVDSPGSDSSSIGGYTLTARFEQNQGVSAETLAAVAKSRLRQPNAEEIEALFGVREVFEDDGHLDDLPEHAGELAAADEFTDGTRFRAIASLSDASDIDYYVWKIAANAASTTGIVSVRALDLGRWIPSVQLLNEDLQVLPSEIIVNGGGEVVIQAIGLKPGGEYRIGVAHAGSLRSGAGNYRLTAALRAVPLAFEAIASGVIDPTTGQDVHQFYVATPQLFHFALQVAQASDRARQGVWWRLLDAQGRAVLEVSARPDETRTGNSVLLTPGTYTAQAVLVSLNGAMPTEALGYSVRGAIVSDPFAVDPAQPSDLEFACPNMSGLFCYPGGIVSSNPFLWWEFLDQLPQIPALPAPELHSVLLGDWWAWYWNQAGVNAPPLALPDHFEVQAGQRLDKPAAAGPLSNDSDPNGDAITAILVDPAEFGTLTLMPDGQFTYQPEPGFVGQDRFRYQAYDLQDVSAIVDVVINVLPTQGTTGDFDGNGVLNATDLDLLANALSTASDFGFDINQDGLLDTADWDYMVHGILRTEFGDANLDGQFDSADLVLAFQSGEYEASAVMGVGWEFGDWNGDLVFSSSDLVLAFQTGKYVELATGIGDARSPRRKSIVG